MRAAWIRRFSDGVAPRRVDRRKPTPSLAVPHRRWEWGTAATLSTHDAVVKLNIAPAGIPLPPLHVNVPGRDVKLAAAPFESAQRWSLRSTLAVRKVRVPSTRKESGSRVRLDLNPDARTRLPASFRAWPEPGGLFCAASLINPP